ncbi:hypothetical protein TNCT_341421 [Trichonephila clavata]|uniref:Uncharacterized protein n=1 Tax=Trichonephila clavata TaxID=2740835 RepID=A0A8X6KTX5_TRICU|nr:hypothetical protein TNCT_341421 [Trichonephila clavata]
MKKAYLSKQALPLKLNNAMADFFSQKFGQSDRRKDRLNSLGKFSNLTVTFKEVPMRRENVASLFDPLSLMRLTSEKGRKKKGK